MSVVIDMVPGKPVEMFCSGCDALEIRSAPVDDEDSDDLTAAMERFNNEHAHCPEPHGARRGS